MAATPRVFTLDYMGERENYVEEQSGIQVGPVVLFGRDGKVWYWLRKELWNGRKTLDLKPTFSS